MSKPFTWRNRKAWTEMVEHGSITFSCTGWDYWPGVELRHGAHTSRQFEMLSNMHTFFVRTGGPTKYTLREGRRVDNPIVAPGLISVVGRGPRWLAESEGGVQEDIGLKLDPDFLLCVAEEAGIRLASPELPTRYAFTDTRLSEILGLLADDYKRGSPYGTIFGESLATVFAARVAATLGDTPRAQTIPSGHLADAVVLKIEEYVRGNLHSSLTLKDIAEYVGYSPYYLHRAFRQRTGKRLFEYVAELRMELAMKLLRSTDWSVARIAVETGFSDASHLSRLLRKNTGLTPVQYRQSARLS